jgi:hypothetical protein
MWCAMSMKFHFIGLIFLFSLNAAADFDLNFSTQYRNHPLSGTLGSDLGYAEPLWGADGDPFMGYVRAAVELEGVKNYFSNTVMGEFFPISLIGIRLGETHMQDHADYQDFDCTNHICHGQFKMRFMEIPVFLGYGPVLFSASYRSETWKSETTNHGGSNNDYIDPTSGLNLANGTKDSLTRIRWAFFYKLDENYRVGYVSTLYKADDLSQAAYGSDGLNRHSQMWLIGMQYVAVPGLLSKDEFSAFFGMGEYSSHLNSNIHTIYLNISYSPMKKIGY